MYDCIIVGAGPAGLTAAIYLARAAYRVLLVEALGVGGQVARTHEIDNFPGYPEGIAGVDLAYHMQQQAERFGAELSYDEVVSVDKQGKGFLVTTSTKHYHSHTVIIASGCSPRKLNVSGEERLYGKGVSYCAICDGAFYRGKRVAVIGGGDSAVKESIYLANLVSEVILIHRRQELRAEPYLVERAKKLANLRFLWNQRVTEILGNQRVSGLRLEDVSTQTCQILHADGVFIYIGMVPNTGFLSHLKLTTKHGYLVTDERMVTSVPGLFAVGDVRHKALRQITTAVGDGATAAHSVMDYLLHRGEESDHEYRTTATTT